MFSPTTKHVKDDIHIITASEEGCRIIPITHEGNVTLYSIQMDSVVNSANQEVDILHPDFTHDVEKVV